MHYHIGAYKRDRLVNAEGMTWVRERAEIARESAAYAEAEAMERHYSADDNYRGLVIDDISDPDYTDKINTAVFPTYDYRVVECTIAPARCMAAYEAVQERARSRNR